jgi:glutamate/aspartate transport system substrate-binding protein
VLARAMKYALATSLLLIALAGPVMAQETGPTLDKIKKKGAVAFGYREASRPFSFLGPDGQPAGYSVDLCRKIATVLKSALGLADLKVSWVPVTPSDRVGKLQRSAIDLEYGSTTVTFERLQQVAFSHMTFVDGGSVLATANSGIRGVKDLDGKRVGVIPNTTTDKALATALAALSIKPQIVHVSETREGLQGLEEGRLDAYASDHLLLAGLLSTAKDPAALKLNDDYFSYEPYALMMRRGDHTFQVHVNRTLSALYRSGAIVEIYERWFGSFNEVSPLVRSLYLLHSWPDS